LEEGIETHIDRQNKEFFSLRDNFQKMENKFREDRTRRENKLVHEVDALEALERLVETRVQEEFSVLY